MVRRHFSDPIDTARTKKVAKKKTGKKQKSTKLVMEIDGRPVEIEKYGNAGIASYRNNAADAMQWFINGSHHNSRIEGPRTDKAIEIAWAEGRTRANTAARLADLFEKAELTPLRSPDYESVPGGSSGPRFVGNSKLTCMMVIQDLRREIPPTCTQLLEAVICRNEAPWHGLGKTAAQRVYQDLRMALDFAAWALDRRHTKAEVSEVELVQRWPQAAEWFTAARLAGKTQRFRMDRPPS
jgi:hypothetical protein